MGRSKWLAPAPLLVPVLVTFSTVKPRYTTAQATKAKRARRREVVVVPDP